MTSQSETNLDQHMIEKTENPIRHLSVEKVSKETK